MRFAWTDEQQLLRASLERYVTERCAFDPARVRPRTGSDNQRWGELAEMGILGLPFASRYGGSEGNALDLVVVMEAFGRGLLTEPFIPSVVLGGGVVARAASEAQRQELLPPLIAGRARYALAFAEPRSRFELTGVTTRATADPAGGYVIDGHKSVVYGAPAADRIFVTARTAGADNDPDGVSLFIVVPDTPGVRMQAYDCIDGMRAADLWFDRVRVPRSALVGPLDAAGPILADVIDDAVVAVCAEAVGVMSALNERCIEYARTRQAFGQPIGNFQVVGHRLVDFVVAYEQASAIVLRAASKLAANADDKARAVAGCKVKVAEESGFVGKAAVQLHGAIGITEELDVSHYFKRILARQTMFGSGSHHLSRYMRLDPETAAGACRGS